jgi:DMSO reductase anchor subunit
MASLRKYVEHWLLIFIIALILLPVLMIGSHYIKILLQRVNVDPVEQEVFNFVSLYLTVLDVVLILATATIGVYRLLDAEVEE